MANYNLKVIKDTERRIIVNHSLSSIFNIAEIRYANLRFGQRIVSVKVTISDKVGKNELYISESIIKSLSIPMECSYHISFENKEINIGPFIGILMAGKEEELLKKLRFINSYVKNYSELNGVVFAFPYNSINICESNVTGYVFNPKKEIWKKTILPLPASIFTRGSLNDKWKDFFGSIYNDKIFNYDTFNKWDMYQSLKQFPDELQFLPDTRLYNEISDVLEPLEEHRDIYVKPIGGKKGLGIYNISINNGTINVKTREKGENLKWTFTTEELGLFLSDHLKKGKYIIQQTIDIKIENKVLDFRIGMDKDQTGVWKNLMFVSRVSGDSSIVSNRAAGGGEIKTIPEVLKNVYKMNDRSVKKYTKKLVSIAESVSKMLERTGLGLGKLAFDFVIDKNNKIWIIEINSRYPDDTLANRLGNKQTYFTIHHTNMLYSKLLSGFAPKDNDNVFEFQEKLVQGNVLDFKRFKVYVAIPFKKKEQYITTVINSARHFKLVGKMCYNNTIKKVELEVQGTEETLNAFIENIKIGERQSNKSIIALEEMNLLHTEEEFKYISE